MQRYHKNIYFESMEDLKGMVNTLNGLKWKASKHSLDRIQEKADIQSIGEFLKDLTLDASNIFEYYKEGANIQKVCFRIPFDGQKDLILVLSELKSIVTVYFNQTADKHFTLNPCNYAKG